MGCIGEAEDYMMSDIEIARLARDLEKSAYDVDLEYDTSCLEREDLKKIESAIHEIGHMVCLGFEKPLNGFALSMAILKLRPRARDRNEIHTLAVEILAMRRLKLPVPAFVADDIISCAVLTDCPVARRRKVKQHMRTKIARRRTSRVVAMLRLIARTPKSPARTP
jgi:hypothetical protein